MIKYHGNPAFKMKQTNALVLLIMGLFFFLTLPLGTNAQQSKSQTSPNPDSLLFKQAPLAIPLSSVAGEGQKAALKIRDIKSKIKAVSIEVDIDSLLPKIKSNLDVLKSTAFDNNELKDVGLRSLKDFYTDFAQIKIQLNNIKGEVIDKYNALQPSADLTAQLQKTWKATSDNLSNDDVPEAIQDRIKTVLKDIDTLKTAISDKQNKFLVYEDEVTSMMIGLDEAIDKINTELQVQSEEYFKQNSPPIWRAIVAGEDTLSLRTKSNKNFESQKKDVKVFIKNYKDDVKLQLSFLVLFFFLLLFFKKRIKTWDIEKKDKKINAALYVINHPFVSALTISILITPLYYPDASETVIRLIFLLSIIPILFLLPGLMPNIRKVYFYLFGLLFVLNEIFLFFQGYYLIGRYILIFYSLFSITLLLFVLRPQSSLLAVLKAKKLEYPIVAMQATIVLYAVGFIANIFGFTVLSNIIIDGCFVIFFVGIMILTGAIVLKSLVSLFMISKLAKKLNVIKLYPNEIRRGLNQITNLVAIIYFAIEILRVFFIYNPFIKWVTGLITKKWEVGDVGISFGNILIFFITLWLSFFISKIIRVILQDEILARLHMEKGVPEAISTMVRIVFVTLGLVLACSAAGINLSNLTIIFGALGVGVGFGLQDIVRNFFAGLILAFERPIRKGDVIKLAGLNLMGEVQDIGIRATMIRTYDGTEVIVPNGNLTSSDVINCTLADRNMRRELSIGVEYGTDVNRVLEILNKTVASNKRVFIKPAPWIIFTGFGESSLNFRITFWTNFDTGMTVLSEVGAAIDEALKKEGIKIPFPQRVLHLGSKDNPLLQQNEVLKDDSKTQPQNEPKSKPKTKPKSE